MPSQNVKLTRGLDLFETVRTDGFQAEINNTLGLAIAVVLKVGDLVCELTVHAELDDHVGLHGRFAPIDFEFLEFTILPSIEVMR